MKKKFEEYYDLDQIESYVDDTPAATLLWQLEKYTKNQLKILHDIPKVLPRKQDLLNLYNRAVLLKDDNALHILANKYGLYRLLFSDDLPDVSDEEVDAVIESVEGFIEAINPNLNREKILARRKAKFGKGRYTKYMDYSGDIPKLVARKYLKDLTRDQLENTVYHFGIPGYKKMTSDQLIDIILKHDKCKEIIINNIKKRHGIYFKNYVIDYLESGEYEINIK